MRALPLALALLSLPALAACPTDSVVFACQIGQKTLEICDDSGGLVYRFGPANAPELTVSEPLQTVGYAPWSGFGRNRFYTVTFQADGFTYEVYSGFDRIGDPPSQEGGVTVRQGGTTLAALTCDPGSVAGELEVIGSLKQNLGQCFDQDIKSWREGSCGQNPEFCACQVALPPHIIP